MPAPDHAKALYESLSPADGYFWDALTAKMTKMAGTVIKRDDFALENLPRHLSFYFRIVNAKGRLIAEGRDLGILKDPNKFTGTDTRCGMTAVRAYFRLLKVSGIRGVWK